MEDPDNAAQARGLVVLQEGVKLGSREAASELASYFRTMHGFAAYNSPDPRTYASEDALRARYYQFLQHSLNETTPERLPNLDAAVPLPPAPYLIGAIKKTRLWVCGKPQQRRQVKQSRQQPGPLNKPRSWDVKCFDTLAL